jgi:hypothetical protein
MNGNRKPLILKGWNGGRAGTRTPDLLRVKQADSCKSLITQRKFSH